MRNRGNTQRLTGALLKLAVGALALLAVAACSDSAGGPAPSHTPQPVLFPTSPAAANTSADDRPGSGIVDRLVSTATPYPTPTSYPTATPYPTTRLDKIKNLHLACRVFRLLSGSQAEYSESAVGLPSNGPDGRRDVGSAG